MPSMRLAIGLFLAVTNCAREAPPVNLGENTSSIGVLPSASASVAPAPSASDDPLPVANDALVVPPILYRASSDQLLPESEKILQRVVDFMNARHDVRLLHVEVHTDSMGLASYNLALSQKRASAVARWLIDHGVDCSRIDAAGYGDTRPIAPNTTEAERARNRRTVFVIGSGGSRGMCP